LFGQGASPHGSQGSQPHGSQLQGSQPNGSQPASQGVSRRSSRQPSQGQGLGPHGEGVEGWRSWFECSNLT